MKNQFVADVNDFYKYGMLRAIHNKIGGTLGIWWMLTNDDAKAAGMNLAYLNNDIFRRIDGELFDELKKIRIEFKQINNGDVKFDVKTRNITKIEESNIFKDVRFWPNDHSEKPENRARKSHKILEEPHKRIINLHEMLSHFKGCSFIFADPDNGIEVKTGPKKERYIRWHEIRDLYHGGHSVISYQHANLGEPAQKTGESKSKLLSSLLNTSVEHCIFGSVIFFIIPRDNHRSDMIEGMNDFKNRVSNARM